MRAAELDMLVRNSDISGWARQCKVRLGEDFETCVDFVVWRMNPYDPGERAWIEEVKGKETPNFKEVRRLWAKHGPCDMKILKRKGNGWAVEWLKGKAQ
jgi:hypothetical protein